MFFLIGLLLGICITIIYTKYVLAKKECDNQLIITKNMQIMQFLNNWLQMYQMGKTMVPYIVDKGYKEVAIYGMGILGQRLCDEFEDSEVMVKYAIDQNAANIQDIVEVKHPSETLENVDAIIVTSLYYFNEIKQMMEKKMDCPIISIYDCLAPEYVKFS